MKSQQDDQKDDFHSLYLVKYIRIELDFNLGLLFGYPMIIIGGNGEGRESGRDGTIIFKMVILED